MMQGLNVSITIYRATQLADDEAGGSQRTPYYQVGTCRGRIANRAPTLEMRAQGLGTDLFYDAAIQPATTDVRENDMIIPTTGPCNSRRWSIFDRPALTSSCN
jgi:hypothetical protein